MSKDKFSFDFTTTWCYYVQLRKVPEDDVRLSAAKDILAKLQEKNNFVRRVRTETTKEGDQEQEHGDDTHLGADGDESTMQDHVAAEHNAEDESSEHVAGEQSSEHVAEEQSSGHVAAVGESSTPLSG